MKKILLLIMAVLVTSLAAMADVTINSTNFPDATFRSYLLNQYPSGTITTAQLNARDTLNLSYKGISDMTGVQYFTQLKRLDLYSNNLTTIDVSANTKLIYLNLGYNKLTSINVDSNTALEQLYLQNNQISLFTVTNHSALRTLWIANNPNLTSLTCYRNAITSFDISNCTALASLRCYENDNLTTIYGLASCTAITYLDCEDCAITDLSAVSGMTNLEKLYARYNQLTSLNVSGHHNLSYLRVTGNTRLTELLCYSCDLTTLVVTGCSALKTLKCYYNSNLTAITGLADCSALTYLDCEDCAITELPGVSDMTKLQTLWCRNNQLTGSLDVSNKLQLKYLRVSGNTGLVELRCAYCALTSLDVTGCTGLNLLHCEVNSNLSTIQGLTDCTALTWFGCDYCALTSLDVTFCPGLKSLYCYNNQLTSLNVTGLTSLVNLNCMNNPDLGSITGLSDCSAMTYLNCSNCGLPSLNVDNMNDLGELWCSGNLFTTLLVINKPQLTALVANDNLSLEELECYSCALTRLEVYNCPVLNYIDCMYNQLTELDVTSCPALQYLILNSNKVTDLNLNNNPELALLWCNDNQLTSLDLSNCADDFYSLDCRYNQISGTLDVSRFTELYQCVFSSNQISQLVLGDHSQLRDLWCQDNQLTSLDASGCGALETLYAFYNQLTSLSVNSPSLGRLYVYSNRLNSGVMGQIVENLPTRSDENRGYFAAVVDEDPSGEIPEENVITTDQVSQANAKYWDVYHWSWDSEGWEPYAGSSFIRGDVNGDGHVTIGDVSALIDYLLSNDASGINLDGADVNGDGHVTIGDVSALIDMLLSGTASVMKSHNVHSASVSFPGLVPNDELVLEKPRRIIK